jgi:hypothetical protein
MEPALRAAIRWIRDLLKPSGNPGTGAITMPMIDVYAAGTLNRDKQLADVVQLTQIIAAAARRPR